MEQSGWVGPLGGIVTAVGVIVGVDVKVGVGVSVGVDVAACAFAVGASAGKSATIALNRATAAQVNNSIILIATFTTLVPYAFCAMAESMLAIPRRAEADDKRRLWVTSLIGILAFAFSFVAIIGAGADTALLLGVPVYVWLRRQEEPPAEAA